MIAFVLLRGANSNKGNGYNLNKTFNGDNE